MVTLYVGGEKVGTLAEADRLIAEFIARNHPIEFRDDSGELVGTFFPKQKPLPPEPLVPWDPTITLEDIERIKGEPGFTFEEVKKRLGWE
ncbi:MAG: hypothetical protein JWO38_3185 [Gemmataceae bacterium]|nr:hypothetical protein [Gemmataceae bacterium]